MNDLLQSLAPCCYILCLYVSMISMIVCMISRSCFVTKVLSMSFLIVNSENIMELH